MNDTDALKLEILRDIAAGFDTHRAPGS